MNTRKDHLKHTTKAGPVCRAGHSGGRLAASGGEHLTLPYAEFAQSAHQCAKCKASKLFAFLQRQASK